MIEVKVRLTDFARDYRSPLLSTAGLIVILTVLLLLRSYERNILAGVLGDSTTRGGAYAKLLSKDKEVTLQKNETSSGGSQPTAPSSTSLTLNSSGNATTNSGTNQTNQPNGGGSEPPPTAPFYSQIAGLGLRGQSVVPCGGTDQACKQYDFTAGLKTFNGPGTVNHKILWQGPNPDEIFNSFLAASGDALNQVNYTVRLQCDQPGPYTFKFVVEEPTAQESQDVLVDHHCGTVMPPPGP